MDEQKKEYREPELHIYGELRQLTLGNNGSSEDGGGLFNQLGGGNDQGKGNS